jgi:hypothetical protein
VRQVQFQANVLPNTVTASQEQIQASVNDFLHGRQAPPKRHTAAVAQAVHRRHHPAIQLALVPTPGSELSQARTLARSMSFPLEYPRVRDKYGAAAPVKLRDYYLRGTDGLVHRAYVAPVPAGSIDQYYDVQGMTWTTAPLFNNSDQTIHVGGRTYNLYYDGQNLKMVAWQEHGVAYWVRNTLINAVGNSSLLAIAEETLPFTVAAAVPNRHRVGLGVLGLPARPPKTKPTSPVQTAGAAAGLLALLGVVALVRPLYRRRRELIQLRTQLRTRLHADSRARALAYTPGVGASSRVPRPPVSRPPAPRPPGNTPPTPRGR